MKKFIPFMFLVTLVSCVDNLPTRSTIPRLIRDVNSLDSSSTSSLKQGQIIRTHKTGTTLNPVIMNADNTMQQHEVNSEVITVVLKVTGNNYYQYQEIHDYVSSKVTKQVILIGLPTKQQYSEAFIQNDSATVTGYSRATLSPSDKIKVKFKSDMTKTVNLKSLMCDVSIENEEVAVVFLDGKEVGSDYSSNSEKTSCDGILNSEEFKNLDLSSIQFCDYTKKEVECGQYNLNDLKK